jgi:uncharacterized protein YuzE
MGKEFIDAQGMAELLKAAAHLSRVGAQHLWIDYDPEADALYVNFQKPQRSTESELLENGVILRYRGDKLVGMVIFDASGR